MKTMFRLISITMLFSAFGCSELLPKNAVSAFIPKNSLIVLDQSSQAVRAFDLAAGTNILIDTLPTTVLNDVKIKGDFAYTVLSVSSKLIRYNLRSGGSSVLDLATGSNPYYQAVYGNRIFVTLWISNQVAVVDTDTFTVASVIPLTSPGEPCGITVDSNNIYVTTSDGFLTGYANSRITVISRSNNLTVTNIACVKNPTSLALDNGKLYITGPSEYDGTGKVQRLDLAAYTLADIAGIPQGTLSYIKVWNGKLYVIENDYSAPKGLYIYDLSTTGLINVLSNKNLQGMDFQGSMLYASESFAGTKSYQLNLTDLSVVTINGIGGGDCALYQ
jgi:YVTN family beta-propeller protein